MTEEQRAEYLRHLEADAIARYAQRIDPVSWALDRHMTKTQRRIMRAWRWLRGAR